MEDTKKGLYKTITTLNKVSNRIHVTNIDREFESRLAGSSQGTLFEIRALAYKYGVPMRLRAQVWKLLLGYIPLERLEQNAVLREKREEYFSLVQRYKDAMRSGSGLTQAQNIVLKDIEADLPRTFLNGFEGTCMQQSVQEFIKRPLFLWSSNNTMGYYQGMMDLIYTLFFAFVAEHESINGNIDALRDLRMESFDNEFLRNLEADLYHCFGHLINFYEKSLGANIMAGVYGYLGELNGIVKRVSPDISEHFSRLDCRCIDFSIRWIICMFLREFDLPFSMKIWDSLFAIEENFPFYILYVSESILSIFSDKLLSFDSFSDLIDFIQKMPVRDWRDEEYLALMKKSESALDRDLHRPYVVNRIFRNIQQDNFKNFYQFVKSSVKRLNLSNPFRDMPQENIIAIAILFLFVVFFCYMMFFSE